FYWDNLIHFGMGPRRQDGKVVLALPLGDRKLPGIAADDIGACAYGIFKKGSEFTGKTVGIAGEHPTGAQMAASLSKALGEEVHYYPVPFDVYRGLGFPGADDLGNMFQYKHDFNEEYCAARDVNASRALNPGLKDFDQWVQANQGQIKIQE
ncbi:MAG TPA: NmrA family NAD(P)-binding protein, partial [Candidatus Methylomirabilis sp.]